MSIYEIDVTLANGENYKLERYKGKVMLIVNTATKCGFTPQFKQLEQLYKTLKDSGLVVLGFPSNQFKQEVDSAKQAEEACRLSYGVTFPMHELVKVNGKDAHPLFNYLTKEASGLLGNKVKWNFTKFLVDQEGNVVKRFAPTDNPSKFIKDIEKYL